MDQLELIFTVCAAVGGGLFLIRLILQVVGFTFDLPSDQMGDVDLSSTDVSFKMLSVLGAVSFLMLFGLAGRAMLATVPGQALPALGVAVAAGAAGMWMIAKMFTVMMKLQSCGLSNPQNAVGREGSVYLNIPANDMGKVKISVNGRLSVLDARSEKRVVIETGTRVRVARVVDGSMLMVEPVDQEENV